MEYTTKGTCSRKILFEITEDNKLHNVQFVGGCNGNTKGIASLVEVATPPALAALPGINSMPDSRKKSVASLVEGMDADEVIKRLKGTDCNGRGTSCPDQLARALEAAKQ